MKDLPGLICSRREYYIIPSFEDLKHFINDDGTCIVKGFTIGRVGYGNMYFPNSMDVSNINIDELIVIRNGEVAFYPQDNLKTLIKQGVQITLDHVYPMSDDFKQLTDINDILEADFVNKLKLISVKQKANFIEYRPKTGSWVFRIVDFGTYRYSGGDELFMSLKDNNMKKPSNWYGIGEAEGFKSKRMKFQSYHYDTPSRNQQEIASGVGNIIDVTTVLDLSSKVFHEQFLPERDLEMMRHTFFGSSENLSSSGSNKSAKTCDCFDQFMDIDEPVLSGQNVTSMTGTLDLRMSLNSRPKVFVLQNVRGTVPPEASMLRGLKCCSDLSLFKRKSFKCGWTKGFRHYTMGEETYTGRHCLSVLHFNDIEFGGTIDEEKIRFLADALDLVHTEAKCTLDENGVPTYTVFDGISYLFKQTEFFTKMADKTTLNDHEKYISSIWELCKSLWAPLKDENDLRKCYLSDWFKKAVDKLTTEPWKLRYPRALSYTKITEATLDLLSMNKTFEAAQLLMLNDCPQLSVLVAQLSSTETFTSLLQEQILYWYHTITEEFLTPEMKKLYSLLSGTAFFQDINICEGLDWKRAFGMHLWYTTPAHAPIHEALKAYQMAFESDEAYTAKPYPPYAVDSDSPKAYDILYHILRLYCENVYLLNHVLDPATHCNNPLDYSMSWMLLQLFRSLRVGIINESSETAITISFANQLENMDQWELAVFVLLFIKDASIKRKHVIEVLERNLSSEATKEVHDSVTLLIKKFRVPQKWIYEVMAWKSQYFKQYWNCYLYFAYAGDFYMSNDIFVTHLLPDLVINQQYSELEFAVKPLQKYQKNITSWGKEIGLVLDFLELIESFKDQRSHQEASERSFCILHEFTRRLPQFPVKTTSQKACIAEISRKCAFLLRFLVQNAEDSSFKYNFRFVMPNFVMPPDYVFVECLYYLQKFLD